MVWQLSVVGLIVAIAAAYLAGRAWRTWGRKAAGCGGCGSGCKTEAAAASGQPARLIPANELTVRRRDGG